MRFKKLSGGALSMSDYQNSLVRIILIFCLSVSVSARVAAESFKERDFKTLLDGTKHYKEINGIYTKPDASPPYPAVIILQSCGGTKNFLFDWARKFNNRGYASLIVQSLEASGKSQCEQPFNRYTVLSSVASNAYGALDYLREKPSIQKNKIAIIGFSMGAGAINDFIMTAQDPYPS
jgi:dienelactone hydrolase